MSVVAGVVSFGWALRQPLKHISDVPFLDASLTGPGFLSRGRSVSPPPCCYVFVFPVEETDIQKSPNIWCLSGMSSM